MSDVVKRRPRIVVDAIDPSLLSGRRVGIEKESLRVDRAGYISQRPHPEALGSALTHPNITTDFSEALLEFVTPAYRGVREVSRSLRHLHRFTCPLIGDEVLWAASMPCMVTGDRSIPIAHYGGSNVGTMKHVYRRGLSHRYGRVMQTISGVHFNFSLPRPFWAAYREMEGRSAERLGAFASDRYFALVRNFHRHGWIVPLLFGSSPAICRSFLGNTPHTFSELGRGTLYEPFATSLRMSDIGYKNESQRRLGISYDSPAAYVRTLHAATEAAHPPYEEIGVVVDGEYRQLNANLLQIENEYYSFVRPKQIARSGEKPTVALQRRGVRYVEIRALDVDPFSPDRDRGRHDAVHGGVPHPLRARREPPDLAVGAGGDRGEPAPRRGPRARPGATDSARRTGRRDLRPSPGDRGRGGGDRRRARRREPHEALRRRGRVLPRGPSTILGGCPRPGCSTSSVRGPRRSSSSPCASPGSIARVCWQRRCPPGAGPRSKRRPPRRCASSARSRAADRISFAEYLEGYFARQPRLDGRPRP